MYSTEELKKAEEIAGRYAIQVPRYTSYPTAVELTPCNGAVSEVHAALERAVNGPLALYLHIPFCPSLCYFCACNKIITKDDSLKQQYLKELETECELRTSHIDGKIQIAEVHLGGGSPSYLSIEELTSLFYLIREKFACDDHTAFSVEIDPRTMTEEKAKCLAERGVTRVSVGVQDFDPNVQRIIHRVQPFSLVNEVVHYLREENIENINFDLIYGLPGQSQNSFEQTLKQVIELKPDRIALYGYAHVNWKVKVQNVFHKTPVPSASERVRMFVTAVNVFQSYGYDHIGLDHFALPSDELSSATKNGMLQRNFMGFSSSPAREVLAVGVSAISDLSGVMAQNETDYSSYRALLNQGIAPIKKKLVRTEDDKLRAAIIENIMCYGSANLSKFILRGFNLESIGRVLRSAMPEFKTLILDGLAVCDDDGVRCTHIGRLFLRNIAACFDINLAGHSGKRIFSQAV